MKLARGTLSILIGVHQFLWHPLLLLIAWSKLYGIPRDVRVYVAFIVHDLGYWGKAELDSPDGETHPELGARVMAHLFGADWGEFSLYHSRFYAKRHNAPFSRLCVADKYALALEPRWFYLLRARASGELEEYMSIARAAHVGKGKYAGERGEDFISAEQWFDGLKRWTLEWTAANRDAGTPEPSARETRQA